MIYLDNAATTRTDDRVVAAMLPCFSEQYANPHAIHRFGGEAKTAVEEARRTLGGVWGVPAEGIVFTSGCTEANGLAILGGARSRRRKGTVVTSAIEHPSVLNTARLLEAEGYTVVEAPVDPSGVVSIGHLDGLLGPEVVLVSVMQVNNEVGTVQPITAIGRMMQARCPRALFHVDATQGFGKVPLDVDEAHVDLLSMSGHKIHGPKGVGALWIRKGVKLATVIGGGGQEAGIRSGTLNVPGVVGLAEAARLVVDEAAWEAVRGRRDRLVDAILDTIDEATFVGEREHLVPHIVCLVFKGVKAETVVHHLDAEGVIVSSGAACSSGRGKVSHVLRAIGHKAAEGAIRVSLSRLTTDEEMDETIRAFQKVIPEVRRFSGKLSR